MMEVGFPPNDKLYLLGSKAYDAMQQMSVEVHYLSCDGVWNPTKKEKPEQKTAATQLDSS
jgi:hypothetical protein